MESESSLVAGNMPLIRAEVERYLPHLNGDAPYSFYELCGFMVALCSSPEWVKPNEWLPLIVGDDMEIPEGFDADTVLGSLMDLYNWVNSRVLSSELPLPPDMPINVADPMANFGSDAPVGQWSRGFYEGHEWLAEIWEHFINDELERELSSYMMPLTFFLDENFARAIYEDFVQTDKSFEDVAEVLIGLFMPASRDYSNLGRTLAEALDALDQEAAAKASHSESPPGRDDPCSCGSGKPYRKCCLH